MKMRTQQPKPIGDRESGPKRKLIALQTYLKKQGKYQINNQTLHLKKLAKEQQTAQSELKKENNKNQGRNKQNRVIHDMWGD